MSSAELLARLYQLNGRIWLNDGRVHVSAPQGALSTEFRSELRAHKEEVRQWLECRCTEGTARLPLVRQTRPERVPLSFAQARLWFLHHLERLGAAYNIPLALRLEGDLALAALEAALVDVVARHESLRTIFPEEDGVPFQRVLAAGEARPALVAEWVAEEALSVRLAEAAATAIDLSREIPLRAWLFKVGLRRHVLLLLLHHIAGDGWSLGPLALDMTRAYAARVSGEAPDFAQLPVQYADYALWQREILGEESDPDSRLASQLSFWRAALAGLPEELSLPTDRARPALASYRGAMVPVNLDGGLHVRLLELARCSESSLFMVLQAGLAALLSRLGAGEDIPIGSPIAGRSEPALWDLVGFFVNTLVLRTDVSGNPTFRELIGRVRNFDLEAFAHQEIPFERVVDALHPERSVARHPLFQIMLALQNAPLSKLTFLDLVVRAEPLDSKTAKFDLTWTLAERYGSLGEPLGIDGGLEYSLDLFEPQSAIDMVARFARLLKAAVETPDAPLHRLEILGPEERKILVKRFHTTEEAMPETTIADLFEVQVARNPEAKAIVFGEKSLSYGELNTEANRLAHYLIDLGVGPEIIVGIALDRSLDLFVALIATLKAGATYLPLEPDYPVGRLARMLTDAAPTIVISTSALRERLPKTALVLTLDSPEAHDTIGRRPGNNPTNSARTCALSPHHPAYIIYTSGSTGRPKGVILPQATLLNLTEWHNRKTSVGRVAQFTSISFDVSLQEILQALLFGKTVVILDGETRLQPEQFAGFIHEMAVTDIFLPNIVLQQLAAAVLETGRDLPTLRNVYQAGEALTVTPLLQSFFERHPACCLHNHYGPAETHVVTALTLSPDPGTWQYAPPIGRPIERTCIYVLDPKLEPVPVGVIGELYATGAGLARGYLNRPGPTAERFVADPHGIEPGARMYRTGDLARWRPDGTLEFLGRADQQVKIRGFRIEPGEIEVVLAACEEVGQAAVIAGEDGRGGKRLVAYIVPAPGAALDLAVLRRTIGEQLPNYMVPAAFVMLDALPLTSNGKLDRDALPPPSLPARPCGNIAAPQSPTEQLVARIWASVLEMEQVDIHENFFDLGGHSLLLTRVHAQLQKNVSLQISIMDLFSYTTVSSLAGYLDRLNKSQPTLRIDDQQRLVRDRIEKQKATRRRAAGRAREENQQTNKA
jgi:amino acid adenylation domain-containing protein